MSLSQLTRRKFLQIVGGTFVASFLTSVRAAAQPRLRLKMYRLSVRGRRGSQAAKKHNANMRFATKGAANRHRAHAGDNSRIVKLDVSVEEFFRLFVRRRSLVADLRHVT